VAKFYGKYRGTVFNNLDPEMRGRIQAVVPDVTGVLPTTWALPCVPLAGKQCGEFAVPQFGTAVWIEFEQGNRDHPIWTGCFWAVGEVPTLASAVPPVVQQIVLQTQLQNSVLISDFPGPTGGIQLTTTTGARIVVNDLGIIIDNGKGGSIEMIGPSVTINKGALAVI
jgi:uncharacterized protein involved in type VI secretion and phage assembly